MKEVNQFSSVILSQNYLDSKFTQCHLWMNHKITELLKRVQVNKCPFICEILYHQRSESHDKNYEIRNPLNLSGTICKEHVQRK